MRSPSWKKPLLLAAALFVLGSFAYWLEYAKKPADEEKENAQKKPFALSTPVSLIEIGKESKRVALRCLSGDACKPGENAKWQIEAPLSASADDSNVNALLQALDAMSATQTIDLSGDSSEKRAELLKQYKLDPDSREKPETPRVSVTQGPENQVTVAYFGDRHPITDGIFVGVSRGGKFDDSKIYLLGSFHLSNVEHPVSHWRNKRLLTLAQNDLVRVQASRGKKSSTPVRVERNENAWQLASGKDRVAADADAVDAWTSAIVFLSAKGFAAEKKDSAEGRKALAGARAVLTLQLATQDSELTMNFLEKSFNDGKNKATQLYATVSTLDPVYELDTNSADRLDRAIKDLRPAKLLTTQIRADAKWVGIEKKGTQAFSQELKLDGDEWKADGKAAQKLRVENLLDRLSNKVIEDFLPAQAPGSEHVTLRVGPAAGETQAELVFWKSGSRLLARDLKAAKPETYRIASDLSNLLPENAEFVFTAPPVREESSKESQEHDGHAH